jgi:hypothetical protein
VRLTASKPFAFNNIIAITAILTVFLSALLHVGCGMAMAEESGEMLQAGRVTVYHDPGKAAMAGRVARESLKIVDQLESEFGLTAPDNIVIRLVHSDRALQKALPDGLSAPSWAAGVAVPSRQLIIIKGRPSIEWRTLNRVVAHETVHLVLGYNMGSRDAPTWLNEGLTMQLSDDFGLDRQFAMFRALVSNRVIPFGQLHDGFPDDRIDAETAYAQSYYLITFLRDRHGTDALGRLVHLLSLGGSPEIALLNVTGQSQKELEYAFDNWIRKRFSILWLVTGPGGLWFLAALLLLTAVLIRRRASKKKLAEWEAEDGPEGDIGRPGGDRPAGGA